VGVKVIIYMVVLNLQDFQVCGEGQTAAFICGNCLSHCYVLMVNLGLYMSNLDVATIDLLFGMLDFEVFVCCLLVSVAGCTHAISDTSKLMNKSQETSPKPQL
jgi:hypothetical protein